MNDWKAYQHFGGFDWASRSHQVVIVNVCGEVVADFTFEHTAAGWELWRQKAKEFGPLAVCVETSQAALVERLLQTENCAVFPINPKAGKAYCTRKAPSGVKTDFRDAWAFADALRVDGHGWKQLAAFRGLDGAERLELRAALPDADRAGQSRFTAMAEILWRMWQSGSSYNAELHAQNQLLHGSWLLQLKPA